MARMSGFWNSALLNGYDFGGDAPVLGYLISAVVGILIVGGFVMLLVWGINKVARKPAPGDDAPHGDAVPSDGAGSWTSS